MPEAAAPALAESLMAESFVAAAPTMFIPEAAMGAEFGTAAAFEGLGAMEGLGGLSALGSEFGTEALFGGLGGAAETAIPTLSEGIAQGVTTGGLGAGEVGINQALVNAEQMQAVNSGFSQAELEAMQQGQELARNARELGQVAETGTDATGELIQNSGQIPTVEAPAYTPEPAGLEQIKEPPLSEAAQRTIEGAKTFGPATSPEVAQAEIEAERARELANYESKINQFSDPQSRFTNAMQSPNTNSSPFGPAQSSMNEASNAQSRFTEAMQQRPGIDTASSWGQQGGPQMRDAIAPNAAEWAGGNANLINSASSAPAATDPLSNGFSKALDFAKNNPFSAASMAYSAYNLLNKKTPEEQKAEEYNGPLSKYKMSPNFQGRHANPQDYQYTPKVYAEGGIASFKSGGKSDSLDPTGGGKIASDYYESMQRQQAQNMPSTRSDPGIYYDLDPDTRYLDPVSAAQIRMAKINKRSNVQAQNMKRPTGLGQINLSSPGAKAETASSSLDPETQAAQGGIMHSGLGGYAAGGNPRLLRGPGDGMSDNIPATIAGKQPARLADGEFVVPADVVSHLGNGSTEAGAKILHAMMTKVRKERTGNPKQGKQINAHKFVPT